jgi:hypothetical protein
MNHMVKLLRVHLDEDIHEFVFLNGGFIVREIFEKGIELSSSTDVECIADNIAHALGIDSILIDVMSEEEAKSKGIIGVDPILGIDALDFEILFSDDGSGQGSPLHRWARQDYADWKMGKDKPNEHE